MIEIDKDNRLAAETRSVYEGTPEFWSVLDESFPREQRLRKQLEIKDIRLQRALFEQTERVLATWQPETDEHVEKELPTTKYNEFETETDKLEEESELLFAEEDLEDLRERGSVSEKTLKEEKSHSKLNE